MRVLEERERMIETYRGLVKKRKLAAASANNNNPSAEKELFRREADPFSIPGFSHAAGSGRMDEEEED